MLQRFALIAPLLVFGPLPAALAADGTPGQVLVTVVSHFDRPWAAEVADIEAFRKLATRHPKARWTHLYNPVAYTQETPLRVEMEGLVKEARKNGGEIGVHTHMYRSLVEASGVEFRTSPSLGGQKIEGSTDPSGYAVPVTAYTAAEIGSILDYTLKVFAERKLGEPRTYCAGFYATSLTLQQEIVRRGFNVSAAAFPPGREIGSEYALAWQAGAGWDRTVTHDTSPYLVSETTILPGGVAPFLSGESGVLLEVPQTGKIDWMVSAEQMKEIFRRHLKIARSGTTTAVCFAMHEEHAAQYLEKYDEVLTFVDGFLGPKKTPLVRYVTCSQLRATYLDGLRKRGTLPSF